VGLSMGRCSSSSSFWHETFLLLRQEDDDDDFLSIRSFSSIFLIKGAFFGDAQTLPRKRVTPSSVL
jgi:hypothetical protein